AYLAS
ncbi:hypothetical protein TIFTF001_042629, partial [Ficus carica]